MTHHSRPAHRSIAPLAGCALAALAAGPAAAYVGPGAGLGVIGALAALLGAAVLLVIGVVWYPVKRLLRRSRVPSVARQEGNADR